MSGHGSVHSGYIRLNVHLFSLGVSLSLGSIHSSLEFDLFEPLFRVVDHISYLSVGSVPFVLLVETSVVGR